MSARSIANPKKHAVKRGYVTKPTGQDGLKKAVSGGLKKNTPRTPMSNRQKPNGKESTASVAQTQQKAAEDLPTTRQKSKLKKFAKEAANEQKPETARPSTDSVNLLTVRQSKRKGMFSFFNKKSEHKQKLESSLQAPAPPTSPRSDPGENLDKMNQENIDVEMCKDKTCVEEICVEEICVEEICVEEICVDEICVDEICEDEICVDEICVDEICEDEICVNEICEDEICVDEICVYEKDKICEESAFAQLQNVDNIKLIKLIEKGHKEESLQEMIDSAPPISPSLESAEDLDKMNQENIEVKICVDEICKDKTSVEEICVKETCVEEICVEEICVEEICVDEICVDEICVDAICEDEICVDEICADEICEDEICVNEICADEICKEKIFKEEIYKDKIRKDKICEERAFAQSHNVNNIKLIKKAHKEESLQEMIDSVRAEFENEEMLRVLQRCEQLLMKLGLLKTDNNPTEEQHEKSMQTNLKKDDADDAINSALNMQCLESPQFKPIIVEYQDCKTEIKQNFPGFSKECKQARCQRILTRCELNLRFYEKMQCAEKELLETMIKVMKDDDYDVLAKPKTLDDQKQPKDDDANEQHIDHHTLPNYESTEAQEYTDEQISLWSEDSFTDIDLSDVSSYDTYSD